ncbi:hypothetical protein M9Y10_005230 [Tritrichomonas musculus]|uniref:peptidylprolyl isomerase n=1 Tax=Tritrichomonas musculus TaxID=1915356 RepID=A0ABR2JKM9_9EUKA
MAEEETKAVDQAATTENQASEKAAEAAAPPQEEIKVTEDGKVTKVILKPGYGPKPRRGQKVTVHYTGTLLDGTKFDSSVDRNKPFQFQIGKGVISGWSLALPTMKVGEKSLFTMTHEYAYGEFGSPPAIPPRATLKFEIELIRINK